ncbi:hypothetical protein [Saliphagus sp. LR7]|uniref:hypothetical protein n=1 Tax=Saliphagus sp. LR7 TaxID=2282654 RepID=UPI000DF819FC|nr:hypothetical protein [Saliphagus sp. LR7]
MDETDEPWEIARDLTQKQYKSLAALRNLNGEARTPEVTGAVEGLYAQIVNQHYQKMIGAGLVEKVDEGRGDGSHPLPREGFKYRITERGREVLTAAQEDYGMSLPEERTVRKRFDRLEGRIGSLEQQVNRRSDAGAGDDDLEVRVGNLEERVDTIEEKQDLLVDDLRKVAEFLEETREEVGLGGFWDERENE